MSESHRHRALYARALSLANLALILTVAGLIAWVSTRYEVRSDWTATSRHTLSEVSTGLLKVMSAPVTITAYVSSDPAVKTSISELIGRYQRLKPDIELKFVDTDAFPEQARRLNITADGELVIEYLGRTEQVTVQTENEVSNALQRLTRGSERFLVFLSGHGERDPRGQANHDLQAFADQLAGRGVSVQPLNLAGTGQVPDNTASLVIAGPTVALTAAEVQAIQTYLDGGGNLFWMVDEGAFQGLQGVADALGLKVVPGTVVDPNAEALNLPDPRYAVVANYPASSVLKDFNLVTILPTATALSVAAPEGWQVEELFQTTPESWSETSALEGQVGFDAASDQPGPLSVGIALSRPRPARPETAANATPPAPEAAGAPPGAADATAPDVSASITAAGETEAAPVAATEPETSTSSAASEVAPAEPQGEQRIVIVGDGDFLANAYLGNSGNLELGVKLINWLTGDEALLDVPARIARDTQLDLSPYSEAIIGLTALLGIPIVLLVSGLSIWWRRRRA